MKRRLLRGLGVFGSVIAAAACQAAGDSAEIRDKSGADIQAYIDALPGAHVVDVDATGVPSFLNGEISRAVVKGSLEEADLGAVLAAVAPVLRADPAELTLKREDVDHLGDQHFRFGQTKNGLEVLGAELLVHARDGAVYAVNGSARGDLEAAVAPAISGAAAAQAARDASSFVLDLSVDEAAGLAYVLTDGPQLKLVFRVEVRGALDDGTPVRDTVLVDARDGSIAMRIPHIHGAKCRKIYSANRTTSSSILLIDECGPGPKYPSSDSIANANYDRLGTVWDGYKNLFNRDSYDNAGATLVSTIHYSNNYVSAFWNGTQMVYGDGDGVTSSNLALSMDVTAHEITHGVTQYTSNLTYAGESGGLNESFSDILGNVIEWYRDGQPSLPNANNFMVGEDIWTPGTPGDAFRYMCDPAFDGMSVDYWTPGVGSLDVHYTSGIQNLAFCLLVKGGTHPRGKSSINVTGIGMAKAAQIFYRSNATLLVASSNFAAAKTGSEQAATQLGYTAAEVASVRAAWQAVGVGVSVPPTEITPLSDGVPVTGISGAVGSSKIYSLAVPAGKTSLTFTSSGGTGDVDMYVKFGSLPTTSSYSCRPYLSGNNETCTFSSPSSGTWYVMLSGYSAYSGVSLVGDYSP